MMRAKARPHVAHRPAVQYHTKKQYLFDVDDEEYRPQKKAAAKKTIVKAKARPKAQVKAQAKAKVKAKAMPANTPPPRFEPVAEWFDDLPNLYLRRPALSCPVELNKEELAKELPDAAEVTDAVSKKLAEARQSDAVKELTEDELFALVAYTHDLGPCGKRSLYAALNEHLRSRKTAADTLTGLPRGSPWEGYLYYLALAVIKLSDESEMMVYRGFKAGKAKLADYHVGRKGQWAGVTSTSRERSVAGTFADGRGTIFRIRLCSGAVMPKGVSFFDFESEVVLAPYTQLRVESRPYEDEDGMRLIDLKALPPEVTVTEDAVAICKAGTQAEKQRLEEAEVARAAKVEADKEQRKQMTPEEKRAAKMARAAKALEVVPVTGFHGGALVAGFGAGLL